MILYDLPVPVGHCDGRLREVARHPTGDSDNYVARQAVADVLAKVVAAARGVAGVSIATEQVERLFVDSQYGFHYVTSTLRRFVRPSHSVSNAASWSS